MRSSLKRQKKALKLYLTPKVKRKWTNMFLSFGGLINRPQQIPQQRVPLKIAYFFTHPALLKSEVHLLKKQGHQVYVPVFAKEIEDDIADIRNIELPSEEMDLLDSFNPYCDVASKEIMMLLNKHFDLIFIYWLNHRFIEQLGNNRQVLTIIRIFGKESPNNYKEIYDHIKIFPNVLFFSAYQEVIDYEEVTTRDRYRYLPLPCNYNLEHLKDKWTGETNKIMFVCSRINIQNCDYYKNIYLIFKKHFGHLDHTIFGKQDPEPIDDSNVMPNVSNLIYQNSFKTYKVMFYYVNEPRLLHFHPLEAIYVGMPVIFMAGGLLDQFSNQRSLGRSTTLSEAVNKVERIMKGDRAFIKSVIASNKVILNYFSEQHYYSHFTALLDEIRESKV